jgi:hypothetical protein
MVLLLTRQTEASGPAPLPAIAVARERIEFFLELRQTNCSL